MAKEKKQTNLSVEDLEQKVAEQSAIISALEKSNEEKDELIATLNVELSTESKKTVTKAVVVKFNDEEYAVVIPKFKFQGVEYTAKDLMKNKELVSSLVAIGSGVLSKM